MKVREEVNKYASDEDKPILLWLLGKYHWSSQWSFVAKCKFRSYGPYSYPLNRVWSPTEEGRVLFQAACSQSTTK